MLLSCEQLVRLKVAFIAPRGQRPVRRVTFEPVSPSTRGALPTRFNDSVQVARNLTTRFVTPLYAFQQTLPVGLCCAERFCQRR